MGEDTIQTPYGELRATALNEMQSSFDTRHLLGVVDALDRFCAQWKGNGGRHCWECTAWRTR